MHIEQTDAESQRLAELCDSDNNDTAFLANLIWEILVAAEAQENYESEQRERE